MGKSSILLGTFFISLGLISIINNYVIPISFNFTNYVWQFFLVFLGISFFKVSERVKILLMILSGIIAGYYFYGIFADASHKCNYVDTVNFLTLQIPINYF